MGLYGGLYGFLWVHMSLAGSGECFYMGLAQKSKACWTAVLVSCRPIGFFEVPFLEP